ncbi:DUF7169 domain-containing protein [Streptomyces sp. NRRL F-5630]|uniref:DUF7169 domain-containing protein n=1 Tax=Streptomyces sp. NRRL F-5630 TaxID=1463864 RepID=UPI003B632494
MTYLSDPSTTEQRLSDLVTALQEAVDEVRQMVVIYSDAVHMPGLGPEQDPDGTGRKATTGPSRPTERTALDERRQALRDELNKGASQLPYAIAVVRGVAASMDRALACWEGEVPAISGDGQHDSDYRAADHGPRA